MFVHGGIDETNQIINECCLLNFNPLRWLEFSQLDRFDPISKKLVSNSPYLAYHTCCLIVPSEFKLNSKFSVYKTPELHKSVLENNEDVSYLYLIKRFLVFIFLED